MRTPLACCLAATLAILVPATALGIPEVGGKKNGLSVCDEQALHLYAEGTKDGLDLGRNRVDDGKLLKDGSAIPEPHPCQWRDRLDAMIHPPAPEPVATADPAVASAPAPAPQATVAPAAASTSSGGCPSYMAAEASSPGAVNSSSGAAGCFQILPSTQANYGCSDVGPDCAARICADVGNSAWAASGATPCDYLSQP